MSLEFLTSKYIDSAEKVLLELKRNPTPVSVNKETVGEVLGWVADYLEDAKYYKVQGKLETSLTSVAYCEGLLDALRLIGAVNFQWPTKQQNQTEKL
jgi:FAD synthetase